MTSRSGFAAMKFPSAALAAAAWTALGWSSAALAETGPVEIPAAAPAGPQRPITIDDLARIRDVDALSVAPDQKSFVILVRQGDPDANIYRTGWFAGDVAGGPLRFLADGGDARQVMHQDGGTGGDMAGGLVRWSPDGQWIAYLKQAAGETQVWRSRADGAATVQVSRNPGNVRDFVWSTDGSQILFTADTPRADRAALQAQRNLNGYRLQDFGGLGYAVYAGIPPIPLEPDPAVFAAAADGSGERAASEAEKQAFKDISASTYSMLAGGSELDTAKISAAFRPPVTAASGAKAWIAKVDPNQNGTLPMLQIYASPSGKEADGVACSHADCKAQWITDFQWSAAGDEVLFSRMGGPSKADLALFAWNPSTGKLRMVIDASDGTLKSCAPAGPALVCLREERLRPVHVLSIDVKTGSQKVLADVNPEFRQFKLGKIERFEWETPRYPFGPTATTRGYLIYPPDYDPKKTYPLFVAPYSADGFARGDAGDEHPLLAYAASGMIVLNSQFPIEWENLETCLDNNCGWNKVYDPKYGYQHMSAYADTTFKGIELAEQRASIDPQRIGIGGVSHGAFVPLYMMHRADGLAALSVAQGSWTVDEYHAGKLVEPWEEAKGDTHFLPRDPEFYRPLDFSYNINLLEAPILFQLADSEMYRFDKQMRDLADAHYPFEAYLFPQEYHFKIQPSHRRAVYARNLDWFRFWLEDREDADPAKSDQYGRWRKLRELQCRNWRATRGDYCSALPADVRGHLPEG